MGGESISETMEIVKDVCGWRGRFHLFKSVDDNGADYGHALEAFKGKVVTFAQHCNHCLAGAFVLMNPESR
jgi:hypothetical protein